MKVLVTGATGVLGRHVVRACSAEGYTTLAMSRSAQRRSDSMATWVRADLATGDGLNEAVAGCDAIIHAASDPRRHKAVDIEGTRRLVGAAKSADVDHLVFVSIVGADQIPMPYYASKVHAEEIVAASGIPFSILRGTQFHEFIDGLLAGMARFPLAMPVPRALRVQSVAAAEAAAQLVSAVENGPGGRLADFGGPESLTLGEAAESWRSARGISKPMLNVPLVGRVASALKAGANTVSGDNRGAIRWEDWLGESQARTW